MLQVKRNPQNPLLQPVPNSHWESYAAFNGNVIKEGNTFYMFYRAMSGEQTYHGHNNFRLSVIGQAKGSDGIHFQDRSIFL